MSTPFYDLASLVIQPSGVKAGKVYAQKPMTTAGQLTFSRASTATRVNSAGLIETVASNVPRLDYTNSTCPRLLLEPQRTNLVLQSEAFDSASWIQGRVTTTANTQVSPSGSISADTITDTITTGTHRIYNQNFISVVSGTTYSSSCFVKAGTSTRVEIRLMSSVETDIGIFGTVFDLSNGTIISGSGSIEDYGNGWFRCTNTGTSNTTGNALLFIYLYNSINQKSYLGTATNTLFIWGAQLEAGAYATSYIPTTTAAVTRLADACSKTGISSLIGQTEGTLFVEFVNDGNNNTSIDRIISVSDGTSNNRMYLARLSSGVSYFVSVASGTQTGEITGTIMPQGVVKIALAYKNNDVAMYVNGSLIGTDTSHTTPATSNLYLGQENAGTTNNLWKPYKQALLFKTRLTNAQLAELTTL